MYTQSDPELTALKAEQKKCRRWLKKLVFAGDPSRGDFGDEGKAVESLGDVVMRRQLLETRLEKIKEQIKLIKSDYDRNCDRCLEPISPERLRVVPETTRCIKCQADETRKHGKKSLPSFQQQSDRQRTPAYAV